MLLAKNDESQFINNINLNVNILCLFEILLNPNWVERICNIQRNWSSNYSYVELSFNNGIDVYFLMDEFNCYINVLHFSESQFNKEDFSLYNLPEPLLDFVLAEPIVSLGTTNLMWANGVELNSLKVQSNAEECFFLDTFFNEPSLININFLIEK